MALIERYRKLRRREIYFQTMGDNELFQHEELVGSDEKQNSISESVIES